MPGRPVPRPRRLQGRQRHAGPRGRRPAPGGRRRADPDGDPRRATSRPGSAATSSRSSSSTSPTCATRSPSPDASSTSLGIPFPVLGHETVVGVSVGIAMARDAAAAGHAEGADDILRHADVAMYTAKAGRQAPLRGVRPGDARLDRRPPRALGRARPERRPGGARRPLPADRRARQRRDRRRRGARPLASPDPRPDPARRVHRPGRGERDDPRARSLGPGRGLPDGRRPARRRGGPTGFIAERQRLADPAPASRHRRRDRGRS